MNKIRKTSLCLIILVFAVSLAAAQNSKDIHEAGTGVTNPEIKEAGQGTRQALIERTEQETETGESEDDALIAAGRKAMAAVGSEAAVGGAGAGPALQRAISGEENISGIAAAVQARIKAKAGTYLTEKGKRVELRKENAKRIRLMIGNASAQTMMEMEQEQVQERIKLTAKLSNGRNAEIKVMPDTASARAIERLRLKVCSEENNCTIELKEVGAGEKTRAAYEVQAEKKSRFLGLFRAKMKVRAQVDAESGEVLESKKPWWAFLASEAEE
ncbi:hypothetical protein KY358_01955 [Candidatus Woesearchaeota archaeon]|nr:hypothetical protein [Candidatus Woesearchaeota archaeon]